MTDALLDKFIPLFHHQFLSSNEDADHDSSFHRASLQRWLHVLHVWRKVIHQDVLFLALLFHSGSIWSCDYARLWAERARLCGAAAQHQPPEQHHTGRAAHDDEVRREDGHGAQSSSYDNHYSSKLHDKDPIVEEVRNLAVKKEKRNSKKRLKVEGEDENGTQNGAERRKKRRKRRANVSLSSHCGTSSAIRGALSQEEKKETTTEKTNIFLTLFKRFESDMFALNVLHFLNLAELFGISERNNDNNNNNNNNESGSASISSTFSSDDDTASVTSSNTNGDDHKHENSNKKGRGHKRKRREVTKRRRRRTSRSVAKSGEGAAVYDKIKITSRKAGHRKNYASLRSTRTSGSTAPPTSSSSTATAATSRQEQSVFYFSTVFMPPPLTTITTSASHSSNNNSINNNFQSSIDKATIFDHVSTDELIVLLSTINLTNENEVLVQFVATKLLDQFFSFFETKHLPTRQGNGCQITRSVRDYLFAVCIKMSALADKNNNLTLIDHNVHIQSICKRQHIALYASSSSSPQSMGGPPPPPPPQQQQQQQQQQHTNAATCASPTNSNNSNMGEILNSALGSIFYCFLMEEILETENRNKEGETEQSERGEKGTAAALAGKRMRRKGSAEANAASRKTAKLTGDGSFNINNNNNNKDSEREDANRQQRAQNNVALPPAIFLFPFFSVGKGSLIGLRVPKSALCLSPAGGKPGGIGHGPRRDGGKEKDDWNGKEHGERDEEGELINCRIVSCGLQVPSFCSFLTTEPPPHHPPRTHAQKQEEENKGGEEMRKHGCHNHNRYDENSINNINKRYMFSYEMEWVDELESTPATQSLAPPPPLELDQTANSYNNNNNARSHKGTASPLDRLLPVAMAARVSQTQARLFNVYEPIFGGFVKLNFTVYRNIFMREILEKGEEEKRNTNLTNTSDTKSNNNNNKTTKAVANENALQETKKEDAYVYYANAPKKTKRKPFVFKYDRQFRKVDPFYFSAQTNLFLGESLLLLYGDAQNERMVAFLKTRVQPQLNIKSNLYRHQINHSYNLNFSHLNHNSSSSLNAAEDHLRLLGSTKDLFTTIVAFLCVSARRLLSFEGLFENMQTQKRKQKEEQKQQQQETKEAHGFHSPVHASSFPSKGEASWGPSVDSTSEKKGKGQLSSGLQASAVAPSLLEKTEGHLRCRSAQHSAHTALAVLAKASSTFSIAAIYYSANLLEVVLTLPVFQLLLLEMASLVCDLVFFDVCKVANKYKNQWDNDNNESENERGGAEANTAIRGKARVPVIVLAGGDEGNNNDDDRRGHERVLFLLRNALYGLSMVAAVPSSVLLATSFFTTLAQRQLAKQQQLLLCAPHASSPTPRHGDEGESKHAFLWWTMCVEEIIKKDVVIPFLLPSFCWSLIEQLEKSLQSFWTQQRLAQRRRVQANHHLGHPNNQNQKSSFQANNKIMLSLKWSGSRSEKGKLLSLKAPIAQHDSNYNNSNNNNNNNNKIAKKEEKKEAKTTPVDGEVKEKNSHMHTEDKATNNAAIESTNNSNENHNNNNNNNNIDNKNNKNPALTEDLLCKPFGSVLPLCPYNVIIPSSTDSNYISYNNNNNNNNYKNATVAAAAKKVLLRERASLLWLKLEASYINGYL